jgi:hypothetical protein
MLSYFAWQRERCRSPSKAIRGQARRVKTGRFPGFRPCTFCSRCQSRTTRCPARRSLLPIAVQLPFSTFHCKCLYSIANNMVRSFMLFSRRAQVSDLKCYASPGHLCRPTRTFITAAPVRRKSVAARPRRAKRPPLGPIAWATRLESLKLENIMLTSKFFKMNTYKNRPQVFILIDLHKDLSPLESALTKKREGEGGIVNRPLFFT